MKNIKNRFLDYVIRDRRSAPENRERVGQNMMLLTVFIFFIFMINFVIIIGTDKKFGVNLSQGAKKTYQQTVTVQAKRGTIFDRNGTAIAVDSTTYSVYAIIDKSYKSIDGKKLYVQPTQYDKVAEILNKNLGIKKKEVLKQLKQTKLFQVSFGTSGSGISYSTMTTIKNEMKSAGIQGVAFNTSPGRMYPNGTFASEFIGLASLVDNHDGTKSLVGKSGLESSLDNILSGQDGTITYEKDKNGNTLLGTGKTVKKAVDGKDVYTTISAPIQTYLETQMDVFQSKTNGKLASATLVNAKTGEILATTQRPTYNADTLQGLGGENYNWSTALFQNNFEPGSTMKVMTLSSAIDDNVFNPNEYYSNANGYTIADVTVNDWGVNEGISSGQTMSFAQGFAYSSNVGMLKLEEKMGNDKWLNYLRLFKFGTPTYFGVADESSGGLPDSNKVSTAMSAFGQAIDVTQAQMLRAFSAVSNNGEMLEPQFISQISDPNTNTSRVSRKEVVGKPVSKSAASQTRNYMVTVGTDPTYGTLVDSTGTPIIQVGNMSVAVKSGTAQIASPDGSGYLTGSLDTINSVVAMVPSNNPDFMMYVTVQQPEHWSAMFWQDVVNPVLEEAYLMKDTLNAPATVSKNMQTKYQLPDIVNKSISKAAIELRQNLVHPVILGSGSKVSKVSQKVGTNLNENQQVLLLTNKLTELPDMYGWTKANVKKFSEWTGISISFKGAGSGKVVKQNVKIGKNIKKIKKITITLGE